MMRITLHGQPVTKKNSKRIIDTGGRKILLPSKAFLDYQENCLWQITGRHVGKIHGPVNVEYVYHMGNERSADLDNLVVGTNDILTAGKVLQDDGRQFIRGIKASFGETDRDRPRVEITITEAKE